MHPRIGRVLPILGLLLGLGGTGTAHAQDAAAGQRAFAQCSACHTINADGRNGVGPNLHGVVGRKAASVEGFRYSAAMREKGQQGWSWTADNVREYIRNPRAAVPGTSMAYPGMRNDEQLDSLIAYLEQKRP
ncbi:c-type cytochrome [Roseomonas sp. GCM10028921]